MGMTDGLSIADAMALAKDNDGFMGGSGSWVFFLFFLLAWGGNGFFGGRGVGDAATQGALTRSDLSRCKCSVKRNYIWIIRWFLCTEHSFNEWFPRSR